MTTLLLRDVRVLGDALVDVRVDSGRIIEVGTNLPSGSGGRTVMGEGGVLLPGLHDHHVHLLATAAASDSILCGPPDVRTVPELAKVLRQASATLGPGDWLRGVGYHESIGGELDRHRLDGWVSDRPIRIQDRSGALWILNSAGLSSLEIDNGDLPAGIERDEAGVPTGRLWRVDAWLRDRIGPRSGPDLASLGRRLAAWGVTGVTDATPDLDDRSRDCLIGAMLAGHLPQRLHLLGIDRLPTDLPSAVVGRMSIGPRKVVVEDHRLPTLAELVERLRAARGTWPSGKRPVAVHVVTRVALVLLCEALDQVGPVPGDRLEHASVIPHELLPTLNRLGVTVVTQPGLLVERGDDYLGEVEPEDLSGLYRHGSLLGAGVPVGLSTDAPYTNPNPWRAIDAACRRTTASGATIGAGEAVGLWTAVEAFTSAADAPGGPSRSIAVGAAADLCLLDALERPTVNIEPRMAIVAGEVVHER